MSTQGEGRPPSNNSITRKHLLPQPTSSRMSPQQVAIPSSWGPRRRPAWEDIWPDTAHSTGILSNHHKNNFTTIHFPMYSALIPVSYTHLTLPTILLVQISVVAVSLKKKKTQKSTKKSQCHKQQKKDKDSHVATK
eukprot:TRINITY_DN5733_c0_g1_i10.p2 TRINITY_DN5733_c0_g1~~TRINITY_DN5733_c0_g1_i10.p2  ORF type:complete len:136 (+),score=18.90 TRINITY_DN5733_c0_g1_i10:144-551(+)